MVKRLYLVDPTHKLPMPGKPGSFFSPKGETVDETDHFWMNLLADGSLTATAPETPAKANSNVAAQA